MGVVGHQVEDIKAPARLQGGMGAPHQVGDHLRRLLVQDAEEREDIPGTLEGSRVVVARPRRDAFRHAGAGNQFPCDTDNGGQIQHRAVQPRVRLGHQHRVGAGAAADIQQPARAPQVQHGHDRAPDAEGAPVHGLHEAPCPLRVVAEVDGRRLDGPPGAHAFGEPSPGAVDILVVADGAGQVVRRPRHERRPRGRRVAVGLARLLQKAQRHAAVEQQPRAVRIELQRRGQRRGRGAGGLGEPGEQAAVEAGEQRRRAIVRAGQRHDAAGIERRGRRGGMACGRLHQARTPFSSALTGSAPTSGRA